MKNFFWNINENRLRAGWRFFFTTAAAFIIFLPVQFLLKKSLPAAMPKNIKLDILLALFSVFITFVTIYSRKYIDKKTVESLGIRDKKSAVKNTLAGFTISFILVLIVILIEISFGWLTISFNEIDLAAMLPKLLFLLFVSGLAVAWWENLYILSYLFLNLKDGCGFWCAVVINTLIASGLHLSNPNATVLSFVGICIIHLYELYALLRTRSLWLVLGTHAGWNFFQGLFGFSVSGLTDIQVLSQVNNTPSLFGGGEFGPEAGLVIFITGPIAYFLINHFTRLTKSNYKINTDDLIAD